MKGKVVLPPLQRPPDLMWDLLTKEDAESRHFRTNIRRYNSVFNMASSSARVDQSIETGVRSFKVNGMVHHPCAYPRGRLYCTLGMGSKIVSCFSVLLFGIFSLGF